MVESDIVSFFDCVSHAVLFPELIQLGVDAEVLAALRVMLRTWEAAPGAGLPQGPDASRVLANLYLAPIDAAMGSIPDLHYFRYMDDIRIVSGSRHTAIAGLKVLDLECRKRNLFLSTKKTKLHLNVDALASLEDAEIEKARYAYDDEDADPAERRRALVALFKRATAPNAEVNSRRAKFSLYRLRALRHDVVLRRTLSRLEDLAPLGWTVVAYLRPWLRRKTVIDRVADYLEDSERNTSDYLSSWLLAAILDEPHAATARILDYSRSVAFDRAAAAYHRVLAVNVLAVSPQPRDLQAMREVVSREYDPEVVRGNLVALHRAGALDRQVAGRAERIAGMSRTVDYLKGRRDLPSLVLSGRRNPI